jgi:hypothetical protein
MEFRDGLKFVNDLNPSSIDITESVEKSEKELMHYDNGSLTPFPTIGDRNQKYQIYAGAIAESATQQALWQADLGGINRYSLQSTEMATLTVLWAICFEDYLIFLRFSTYG